MNGALREEAIELLYDYAGLIDDDRLEDWLTLFTEDARYQVLPRENADLGLPVSLILCTNRNMIRDRIVALRSANEYNLHFDRHLVTNVRAHHDQTGLVVIRANYAVMQTSLEGETRLFSVGRYAIKARREEAGLKICEAIVVVDSFAVPTLLATPL